MTREYSARGHSDLLALPEPAGGAGVERGGRGVRHPRGRHEARLHARRLGPVQDRGGLGGVHLGLEVTVSRIKLVL